MTRSDIPSRENFHWYERVREGAKLTAHVASAMVGGALYGALEAGLDVLEAHQAGEAEKQADFDRIEAFINDDRSHKPQ